MVLLLLADEPSATCMIESLEGADYFREPIAASVAVQSLVDRGFVSTNYGAVGLTNDGKRFVLANRQK